MGYCKVEIIPKVHRLFSKNYFARITNTEFTRIIFITGAAHRPPVSGLLNTRRFPIMTGKELSDNLAFLSALKMLRQLVEDGLLNTEEAVLTRRELTQRLRPTLIIL